VQLFEQELHGKWFLPCFPLATASNLRHGLGKMPGGPICYHPPDIFEGSLSNLPVYHPPDADLFFLEKLPFSPILNIPVMRGEVLLVNSEEIGGKDENIKAEQERVSTAKFDLNLFNPTIIGLLKNLDKDSDGFLTPQELEEGLELIQRKQHRHEKNWYRLVIAFVSAIAIFLAIVFGLVWAIVVINQQMRISPSGMMTTKNSAGIAVQTSPALYTTSINASWPDEALSGVVALEWKNAGTSLRINVDGYYRIPTSSSDSPGSILFFTQIGRFLVSGSELVPANGTYGSVGLSEIWADLQGSFESTFFQL
jgi:hypothetical protein